MMDKLGVVKGAKYGLACGLVLAILGGVAVNGGGVGTTGLTSAMFGGIGFALGLAEGLLE
jgi:hypothetical protein